MGNNLTGELVLRRIYDSVSGGIKTTPASSTVMEIEIDAADGDNVLTKPDNNSTSVLLEELDATGMKTAAVYADAGAGTLAIEVSPVAAGDVWVEVATVTAAAGVVVSPIASICAKRVRIVAKAGTPTGHLVIQAV